MQIVKSLIGHQPGVKAVIGVLMSFVTFLFGPWHMLLYVLGVLFIFDFITGLVAAGLEGNISSREGIKRIPAKVGMAVIIALGHFADVALQTDTFFRDACLYFYCTNEILSIIENAGRIGVPIPDIMRDAVKILRNKDQESEKGERRDV